MASDMTESQPDGPVGGCDGYTDVGRMYYVDDIDGASLELDLETGDGEWLTQHDVEVVWVEATPREIALAVHLRETELDYQRQIAEYDKTHAGVVNGYLDRIAELKGEVARLVKERDDYKARWERSYGT